MSYEARGPTVAQLSQLVGIMPNQDRILGYRGRDIVVLSEESQRKDPLKYGELMMNPRVKSVKPSPDYTLTLLFTNGEVKSFDVKPYLDIGIFTELKDMGLFNSVKPFLGSVQWKNGQDFCPDTLYMESASDAEPVEFLDDNRK